MKSGWIPFDYLVKCINERKFAWMAAPDLKYLTIRVDTRDDHATLSDRHGNCVARTVEELDALFTELNAKVEDKEHLQRETFQKIWNEEEQVPLTWRLVYYAVTIAVLGMVSWPLFERMAR